MNLTLGEARNVVDQLFASSRSRLGPLTRVDDGRELLPGVLFQFQMESEDDESVRLQLYSGLGETARELWDQELRALNRLSDLGHPHLPIVRDGGEEPGEDVAWIATSLSRYSLDVEGAMEFMAQHPIDALDQLILLADAVSQMHGRGLYHRNIWPGAVEVAREPGSSSNEPIMLRLSRFEMSTLVSHLLRHLGRRPETDGRSSEGRTLPGSQGETVRPFYFDQGLAALDGCPPERLAFLYPDAARDALEEARSDIYGLGMLAYRWFIDPKLEPELGEIFTRDRCDWAKLEELWKERRRKIGSAARRIPPILAQIIESMLADRVSNRLTHYELLRKLTENYRDIAAHWQSETLPASPHLVGVFPEEFHRTLYTWGWITQDPRLPEGWRELQSFLEDDLRGGSLIYSEDGFIPYRSSITNELMQVRAKYVLLGRSGAYFASLYEEDKSPFGNQQRVEVPEVLQIRFPLRLDRGEHRNELSQGLLQQWLPDLEFRKSEPGRPRKKDQDARPSWVPLLERVRHQVHRPKWKIEFERALTLLLEVHQAELDVRKYPFTLAEGQKGNEPKVTLCWDQSRDNRRIHSNSLLHAFATLERRAAFGDFFDNLESDKLVYWSDQPSSHRGSGYLLEKNDSGEIVVQRTDSFVVPDRGWIEPYESNSSYQLLMRQRRAKEELFEHRGLPEQLHRPRSVVRKDPRWEDAGKGLKGPASKVVQEILSTDKLYAVHGPPGTGKTTIAARAIEAQLLEDPSQRILVTSQSHFSLDNMAERILSLLERYELLAVRIASSQSEVKVSGKLQSLLPRALAEERVKTIKKYCSWRLASRNDSEKIQEILGRWKVNVSSSIFEIMRRIRRGANLVFATCGAATPYNLQGTTEQGELFDWVIVEEAARAWPTELAIPLVRGQRWTLIGDHRQLPAFGRDRMEALLEHCEASPDPELRERTQDRESLLRWFDLFKHLFDESAGEESAVHSKRLWHPHGVLTRQFRMREPIARLVSNVFYNGQLSTDPSTERDHGLQAIPSLRGESLLWLDTSEEPRCFDRPRWRNEGEAEIVARLVQGLRDDLPGEASGLRDRLAILTPYWDQIDTLSEKFVKANLEALTPLISTVDSFQGKEADIVILSLVRQNEKRTPIARLGHLASPARVNVMLSRGRQLLLLVGSFLHFENSGVEFWTDICKRFPVQKRKSPGELLGGWNQRQSGGRA